MKTWHIEKDESGDIMGLFTRNAQGQGWFFEGKSNTLYINGELEEFACLDFEKFAKKVHHVVALDGARAKRGGLFDGMKNLVTADLSKLDVSECESLASMFQHCWSLTSLDLSSWNITNVKYMSWMFHGCTHLESIKTGPMWIPQNVTEAQFMFDMCYELRILDIVAWPPAPEKCSWMFCGCTALEELDLSSMDVSKVEDFYLMFGHCRNLRKLNLNGWDVSNATTMEEMFQDCPSLETLDLTGWDIDDDTNTELMFDGLPKTAHVLVSSESVARLLPEGVEVDLVELSVDDFLEYLETVREEYVSPIYTCFWIEGSGEHFNNKAEKRMDEVLDNASNEFIVNSNLNLIPNGCMIDSYEFLCSLFDMGRYKLGRVYQSLAYLYGRACVKEDGNDPMTFTLERVDTYPSCIAIYLMSRAVQEEQDNRVQKIRFTDANHEKFDRAMKTLGYLVKGWKHEVI